RPRSRRGPRPRSHLRPGRTASVSPSHHSPAHHSLRHSWILVVQQSFDVLGHDVDLHVDAPAPALPAERGDGHGVWDHGHGEPVVEWLHDREAAPIDGDRALLHDVADELGGHAHPEVGRGLDDLTDGVDVALHEMPADTVCQPQRALEVHGVTRAQVVEVGAREGLVDCVRLPPPRPDLGDGHAAAVDRDRVADLRVLTRQRGVEAEAAAVARLDPAQLLDYPGEHDSPVTGASSTLRSPPSCSTDSMRPRHTSAIVAAPGPANSGRESSPPDNAGARYSTWRSTRPARWKAPATVAPPSTRSCTTSRCPSSSSTP